MKHYAIGDIHGRLDLLQVALKWLDDQEPGTVFFLGDYIDRGPNSKGVLDTLIAGPDTNKGWVWKFLSGNHEEMAVDFSEGAAYSGWWENGGKETAASYEGGEVSQEHLHWMKNLPKLFVENHRVFVHAGVSAAYPFNMQPQDFLLWWRYADSEDFKVHGRYVVHGHTSLKTPFVGEGRCNLDVGSCWRSRLALAVFDADIEGPPTHVQIFSPEGPCSH